MSVYKRYKRKRLKSGDENWSRGKWWMEFRLRGHDVHQSIPGARTQAQAERAENAVREDIYNGRFNRTGKTVGFSDYFDLTYMPWARENKRSWGHDECRGKVLKRLFKNTPLRDITPMLVRRFKSELKGSVKGATFNRYRALLSRVMEMAFEEELVDVNPVRRVRPDAEHGGRERFLTYEEEERLLPQLTGRLAHLYAPVVVDIDTGMRVYSELLKLEILHCNFGRESVYFQVGGRDLELKPDHLIVVKSKNGKPRTILMTKRVRETLLQVIQDREAGYVFCSHRTGVSYRSLSDGFRAACEAAGIPYGRKTPGGITLHDLRHTFSTRLAERNVHDAVIQALLGHSSVKMSRHYTHATLNQCATPSHAFRARSATCWNSG